MKQWSNGVGVGVGGRIQQVTDDERGLAEQLDGFRGRSFGIGPNVTDTRQLSNRK
jgi:hypothetical protein